MRSHNESGSPADFKFERGTHESLFWRDYKSPGRWRMKERPILFSGEMVRAILAGTKTQTRRPVRPQPLGITNPMRLMNVGPHVEPGRWFDEEGGYRSESSLKSACPFGQTGNRLWVRETWAEMCRADAECHCENGLPENEDHYVEYRADTGNKRPGDWPEPSEHEFEDAPRWRPSIHMPRSASRITLEITDVRVERLQDISEADAQEEGCSGQNGEVTHYWKGISTAPNPRAHFSVLWNSIYGGNLNHGGDPECWDANPWVWAISFKRVQP